VPDGEVAEAAPFERGCERPVLVCADLGEKPAAGTEEPGCRLHDSADEIETVGSAVEGDQRLVPPHVRRQKDDLFGGDVGSDGGDDVERTTPERFPDIAEDGADPVALCAGDRLCVAVDPSDRRPAARRRQMGGDSAGPGAEASGPPARSSGCPGRMPQRSPLASRVLSYGLFSQSENGWLERTKLVIILFTVPANADLSENEMAQAAVSWLQQRLPASWEIAPTARAGVQTGGARADAAIDIRGSNTFTTMAVEVKRVFGPRDVDRLFTGVGRTLRVLSSNIPILLVAPWLSRRTQELLADVGINYLDLTGNALIRLEYPMLYIETQGALKDPSPTPKNKARVQGPKAGRLIRLLVDVRPPYGVRELATAAGLAVSYVSRVLDTLDDEALVERSERGRVVAVDIGRLVRRWVETYDVFRSNKAQRYLAPAGATSAVDQLRTVRSRTAVTGSFAAGRIAPVAAPALLAVYVEDSRAVVDALGLIPADQGANVALLTPFDPVAWERAPLVDGLTYVAPSQAAGDCLTGNGRMPAEGEALLQWMTENESLWRLDKLPVRGVDD